MEKIQVSGDFALVGQICYERGSKALEGVGIRLYQAVDPKEKNRQFLCVEDAETGNEEWYKVTGVKLEPVSLQGLEHLPRDPR